MNDWHWLKKHAISRIQVECPMITPLFMLSFETELNKDWQSDTQLDLKEPYTNQEFETSYYSSTPPLRCNHLTGWSEMSKSYAYSRRFLSHYAIFFHEAHCVLHVLEYHSSTSTWLWATLRAVVWIYLWILCPWSGSCRKRSLREVLAPSTFASWCGMV